MKVVKSQQVLGTKLNIQIQEGTFRGKKIPEAGFGGGTMQMRDDSEGQCATS